VGHSSIVFARNISASFHQRAPYAQVYATLYVLKLLEPTCLHIFLRPSSTWKELEKRGSSGDYESMSDDESSPSRARLGAVGANARTHTPQPLRSPPSTRTPEDLQRPDVEMEIQEDTPVQPLPATLPDYYHTRHERRLDFKWHYNHSKSSSGNTVSGTIRIQ
jgi:hypothetical protein